MALIVFQIGIGQTKIENEKRITKKDFPQLATLVLNALPHTCKRLKLYRETDGDKVSFEAKFKHKNKRYSLEFSEDGKVEDAEVLISFKDIEQTTKQQIETFFKQSYLKHKIIKIQKQYVLSTEQNASEFILNILSNQSKAQVNFEIIAEVKSENEKNIREFTFDSDGTFLNFRILKSTSYEHVLY